MLQDIDIVDQVGLVLTSFSHGNSIEKLPDGNYLMSGRRSYAIYKISAKDGSIMWRLGGKKSDFKLSHFKFTGQHDARFHTQNETHMIISFLDNASGPGRPHKTNDYSRGLLLALDLKSMTAEVIAHHDHPHEGYAPARGNYQTLANGNAFLGWTVGSLQSEHTPNGDVIMEAKFKSGVKSYRNYKFPWVGRPSMPPDVYSGTAVVENATTTMVYVSWNGATEVGSWILYKSTANGTTMELVASTLRQGFETMLTYPGFASYVVVEALDRDGKPLGESQVVTTIPPPDKLDPAVIQEAQWLEHASEASTGDDVDTWQADVVSAFNNPVVTFVCGILFCAAAGLSAWAFWSARRKGAFSWRRKAQSYEPVSREDMEGDGNRGG